MSKLSITEKQKVETFLDEMLKDSISSAREMLTPKDIEDAVVELFSLHPDIDIARYCELQADLAELDAITERIESHIRYLSQGLNLQSQHYYSNGTKCINEVREKAIRQLLCIWEKEKLVANAKKNIWLSSIPNEVKTIIQDMRKALYPEEEEI